MNILEVVGFSITLVVVVVVGCEFLVRRALRRLNKERERII